MSVHVAGVYRRSKLLNISALLNVSVENCDACWRLSNAVLEMPDNIPTL
jgi:hypothetical protein